MLNMSGPAKHGEMMPPATIEAKSESIQQLDAAGMIDAPAIAKVLGLEDFNPAQKFFESMLAESKKSHCGEHFQQYTRNLLVRAQEAGIYKP